MDTRHKIGLDLVEVPSTGEVIDMAWLNFKYGIWPRTKQEIRSLNRKNKIRKIYGE